jgi:hypothetical protein
MIVMAFMLASCSYGFGQHIANLTPQNKIMTLKVKTFALLYHLRSMR